MPRLNLRPDPPDFRDRMYSPTLRRLLPRFNPQPFQRAEWRERVKNQGESSACTGFALSAMVEALLARAFEEEEGSGEAPITASPWMLYYFARRYDEFEGDRDEGSSARAAMKSWHKHGACPLDLWPEESSDREPGDKSWVDLSFRTPLGAYYRVDHTCVPDLHAAINETGAVYATATVHSGWNSPANGLIDFDGTQEKLGGHAFLLVGYDEHGFWVQNSWGRGWGREGFARISYLDWHCHAMDAWVGQLGVSISSQLEEMGAGLRRSAVVDGTVRLSSNPSVRNQQINPYVVNLGNNGRLSDKGTFRTNETDLQELVTTYLNSALQEWQRPDGAPIDVALYAHGGLTPERAAADTASRWIPALFARGIYPVFLMWETGLLDTVRDILSEIGKRPETVGGWWDRLLDAKDDRLDMLLSRPGTLVWDEMKENAWSASHNGAGGLHLLYRRLMDLPQELRQRLRFHLIGHSAGAIFHCHLLPAMVESGLNVDGVYFMAPACTVELFRSNLLPRFGAERSKVRCYTQFHLEDFFEQKDTCTPLYNRSLLYMVSNAFEPVHKMPILGMEKFVREGGLADNPGIPVWDMVAAPTRPRPQDPRGISESISHGGFDNDPPTMAAIVERIAQRAQLPL